MFKGIDYKWLVDQWNKNKASLFSLSTFLMAIVSMYFLYNYMEKDKEKDAAKCVEEIKLKNKQLEEKDKKIMLMYDQMLINNNLIRENKLIDTIK